ncbi:MAG: FUSC family protein [Thermomicrobiales bacterium]
MLNTISPPHPSVMRRLAHPFVSRTGTANLVSGVQMVVPMFAPLIGGHIFHWPQLDTGSAMVGAILVGTGGAMLPARNRALNFGLLALFMTALFWVWLQIPHTLGWHIPIGMLAAALWVTAFVLAGTAFMPFLASSGFMMVLYYMLPVAPGTVRWVFAGAAGAAAFAWVIGRLTAKPTPAPRATIASLFDHLSSVYATLAESGGDEQKLHELVKTGRGLQQQSGPLERNPHLPVSDRKLAMAASSAIDGAAILTETRLLLTRGITTAKSMPESELKAISAKFAAIADRLRGGTLPNPSSFPSLRYDDDGASLLLELNDVRAVSDRLLTRLKDWDAPSTIPDVAPTIAQRLRTGFAPGSLMLKHLARFVVAMGIVGVISWLIGQDSVFRNDSHWMALGLFVALQPGYSATVIRGVQRAGGTIIGGALCFALVAILPGDFWFGYLVPVFALIGMSLASANYTWMAIPITPLVVIGFSGSVAMHYDVLAARIGYTALGCLLAIIVRAVLWPSWKRDELPEIAARALAAQTAFFGQLRTTLISDTSSPESARALIDAGRTARTSLDALAEAQHHMLSEPLAIASKEIDELIPLIEDLRRMSFGLSIRAHQEGGSERERMIANLDVIERTLAEASARIEQIVTEGKTQTNPVFDLRTTRTDTARGRIAQVEAEIASLAPVARFIRDRVDALKTDGVPEPVPSIA